MLDFEKYECYNLPHVTTCPVSPMSLSYIGIFVRPQIRKVFENPQFEISCTLKLRAWHAF